MEGPQLSVGKRLHDTANYIIGRINAEVEREANDADMSRLALEATVIGMLEERHRGTIEREFALRNTLNAGEFSNEPHTR